MIYFEIEGSDIHCCVNSNIETAKPVLVFTRHCSCEAEAIIIMQHLRHEYYKNQESIKGKFYRMGYSHGRAKKRNLWR